MRLVLPSCCNCDHRSGLRRTCRLFSNPVLQRECQGSEPVTHQSHQVPDRYRMKQRKVTKDTLIRSVARSTNITVTDAHLMTDAVLAALAQAITSGGTVEIRGLGTFTIRRYPLGRGIHFRAGAVLKQMLHASLPVR